MTTTSKSGTRKATKESVDEILFNRSTFRRPIARENTKDALEHTKKVLDKARKRRQK